MIAKRDCYCALISAMIFITSKNELIDVVVIIFIALYAFVGFLRRASTSRQKELLLFVLLFAALLFWMLLSRYLVVNDVDGYANQFVKKNQVSPKL